MYKINKRLILILLIGVISILSLLFVLRRDGWITLPKLVKQTTQVAKVNYKPGEITIVCEEETDLTQLEESLKKVGLEIKNVTSSFRPHLYFKAPPEGVEAAMQKIQVYPEVDSVDHNRDISVSVRFRKGTTKSQALAVINKEGYANLLEEIFTYPWVYVKVPIGQEEQYIGKIKQLPFVIDAKRSVELPPAVAF
jgi:hypothetical protein